MSPEEVLGALNDNADNFRIRPLSQPHDISPIYLERSPYTPLFSYGIVNPNGPTLQAILVVRDGTAAPLTLVSAFLHPFAPKFQLVGHLVPASPGQRALERDLLHLLDRADLHFRSCATLLMRSRILSLDQTLLVASQMLMQQDDLARRLYLTRRFPSDPWTRVSLEVGNEVGDAGMQDDRPLPATIEECAAELAVSLLDEDYVTAELSAFLAAWKGAIEHGPKSQEALSLEQIQPILEALLLAHDEAVGGEPPRRLDS